MKHSAQRRIAIDQCARIAEEEAAKTADGEGEIYIARKIADRIRKLATMEEPMNKEAKAVLSAAGITSSQSFDSLNADQIAAIRAEAALAYHAKHGKPMPEDSSSYIRKRFDLVQRRARS